MIDYTIRSLLLWLLCTFLLSFLSGQVAAQENPQLLFDRANDALAEGDITRALNEYRSLEEQKRISGALYLNMGIAYSQIDSLGMAKYYFMKASQFEETKIRAQRGLEYVESRFSRQSAVLPKLPWEKAVDWLRVNVGAKPLLATSIILLNLGVILYVLTWFISLAYEKWIDISGITLALLGILIMALSFYINYVDKRYSHAVMIHNQTNVFKNPTPEAEIISQAYEGYDFTVDQYKSEEKPGWSYVRMSNGLYGWIQNSEILIL